MKKIYAMFTMLLVCSMSLWAANVKDSYTGTLTVTVNSKATTYDNRAVTVTENGSQVTIEIPNFRYLLLSGKATIVADIAADGTLSNPQVTFLTLPISNLSFYAPSSVTADGCEIHLSMTSGSDGVKADFVGE